MAERGAESEATESPEAPPQASQRSFRRLTEDQRRALTDHRIWRESQGREGAEAAPRHFTQDALDALLEAHETWLESDGREGSQADLVLADLRANDLGGRPLRETDLRGAILEGKDLSGCDLSGAKLDLANLRRAKLKDAELDAAIFRYADLSGADLRDARLTGRAQLYKADLRDAILIGTHLKGAFLSESGLQDAYLNRADLTEADLSHCDLTGAKLEDATLLGTDLRGATLDQVALSHVEGLGQALLQDADLRTTKGLFGNEFARADLTGVQLPKDIAQFAGLEQVATLSQHARNIFLAVIGACVYCWLTIAATTDLALVLGASATPLPIIQTPVSIAGFFVAAPAILVALYLYLHLYLQRLWEGVAELPAVFPDGRPLDRRVYPWLLSGLASAHVPLLKERRPPLSWLQVFLSVVAAWGLVPFTLFLFWGRYLVRHDWPWTLWHVVLFVVAAAFGLAAYRLAATTLRGESTSGQELLGTGKRPSLHALFRGLRSRDHRWVTAAAVVLLALSVGGIEGTRWQLADSLDPSGWRQWLPAPGTMLGYPTHADLRERDVSTKPSGWTGLAAQPTRALEHDAALSQKAEAELAQVKGGVLAGANLREADAQRAFLAKADLRRANLRWADLRGANLQGADLTEAHLNWADLSGGDLRKAALIGTDLRLATLVASDLGGADLNGTDFTGAGLIAASFERANPQLNELLKNENLALRILVKGEPRPAVFERARLADASFREANLHFANFRGAGLARTDFGGANLSGADLRESVGLTQGQLDNACGDAETKLPPGLTIRFCRGAESTR